MASLCFIYVYLEPGGHVAPVARREYDCVELILHLAVREPDPSPRHLLHCSYHLVIMFLSSAQRIHNNGRET